jgi:EmrB/QacA subfamily drug resistance transporter
MSVTSTSSAAPSAPANLGHPHRWRILAVLVISLLVVVLDNTVLNVALRTIADPVRGLGASQSQLEWAINSYTLVFAGLLFTWGVLGDRIGRRRMLLAGLVMFGLASLASAYAQTPVQLIGARALMGIGGAAVLPATLSIISNVFDPRERGKAIGVWAGSVGLGVAIGPVVGGALLEHFWWGSVFLINVPIVLFGVIAVALMVPESRDPNRGRLDLVGVALSIVGLIGLVYGIIAGGDHGFGDVRSWASLAGGVAVLAAFVWWERSITYPSLDVRLFRDPRFAAATGAVATVFFAAMGTLFFMSFYLQLVRGYSPLETGLLFMPFAVAQLVFAPRSAAMVRRFGPKAVCAVGLSLVGLALLGLATLNEHTPLWVLGAYFFVQGVGMANVMPPVTESIMASLPREKAGVGSAISNTVRQVAGALGIAVLGSVLSAVYRSRVGDHLGALPSGQRAAAGNSISATYATAGDLAAHGRPGVAGQLVDAGNTAFVGAMHWAAWGSVAVALVGVAIVLGWLPARSAPFNAPAAAAGDRSREDLDREAADLADTATELAEV